MPEDKLITRKEAMHLLQIVNPNTFQRLVDSGKLPGMRPSGAAKGKILFWRSEVIRYLNSCRNY